MKILGCCYGCCVVIHWIPYRKVLTLSFPFTHLGINETKFIQINMAPLITTIVSRCPIHPGLLGRSKFKPCCRLLPVVVVRLHVGDLIPVGCGEGP